MTNQNMNSDILKELGYSEFFEEKRKQLESPELSVARVIAEYKGAYRVKNADGEYLSKITGKQIFEASGREDYPAVGDWVLIEMADESHAVIRGLLPRSTMIKRKYRDKVQVIATNIDTAFVVESADRDYNLNRFERYFAIAENGGVRPAIILNKTDLLTQEEATKKISELKNRFSKIDIIFTSTVSNEGLADLRKYIVRGKTYCFLGSSGVGKSTLINKLLGREVIQTGGISSYSGRGKHITTARQLYVLPNGGIVIDNPGMREVGMADTGEGIDTFFDEIVVFAKRCRYANCTHIHEPGCEVIKAVKSDKLSKEKYENYINLKKEAEFYEMDDIEKREKSRKFGKFKKNALKELKHLGPKDLS